MLAWEVDNCHDKNRKEQIELTKLNNININLVNRITELEAVRTKSETDIEKYILSYYRTVSPVIAREIAKNILASSEKHDVPFVTTVAVMEVESQFNPAARSSKGARGLMQVMPNIWMHELNLTSKYDFHSIQIGINSGAYILRKYLNKYDNNMEKALYKYVGGDNLYVKRVYECMGKFVVYRSFANMTVSDETKDFNVQEVTKPMTTFIHTVKYHGETLSLIAKWYMKDMFMWKKLLELNPQIIPEKMPIGAKIKIPTKLMKTQVELIKEFVQTTSRRD